MSGGAKEVGWRAPVWLDLARRSHVCNEKRLNQWPDREIEPMAGQRAAEPKQSQHPGICEQRGTTRANSFALEQINWNDY